MSFNQMKIVTLPFRQTDPTLNQRSIHSLYSDRFVFLWNYHKPTLKPLSSAGNPSRVKLKFRVRSRYSHYRVRRQFYSVTRINRLFSPKTALTNRSFLRSVSHKGELGVSWLKRVGNIDHAAPSLTPHHHVRLWHPIFLFHTPSWDLLGFSHHATRWLNRHHQTSLTKPYVFPKDFPVLDKRTFSVRDASQLMPTVSIDASSTAKIKLFEYYLRFISNSLPMEILQTRKHNVTDPQSRSFQRVRRLKWPTINFLKDLGVRLPTKSRPPVFRFIYLQKSLIRGVDKRGLSTNSTLLTKCSWLNTFSRRLPVKPSLSFRFLRRKVVLSHLTTSRNRLWTQRHTIERGLKIHRNELLGASLPLITNKAKIYSPQSSHACSTRPLHTTVLQSFLPGHGSLVETRVLYHRMKEAKRRAHRVLKHRPKARGLLMRYSPQRSVFKTKYSRFLTSFYFGFHHRSSFPRRRRNLMLRWLTGHFKVPGQKDYTNLILPNFFLRRQLELNVAPKHSLYVTYFNTKIGRPASRFQIVRQLTRITNNVFRKPNSLNDRVVSRLVNSSSRFNVRSNQVSLAKTFTPAPSLNLALVGSKSTLYYRGWDSAEFQSPTGELKLKPSASKFFTRSPFFFTALLNLNSAARSDFISVKAQRFGTEARLPVFPIRNRMKISVFRQLTFAKQMFSNQVTAFSMFSDSDRTQRANRRGSTLHSFRPNAKAALPNSLGGLKNRRLGGWTTDWISDDYMRNFGFAQRSERPRNPIEYEARVGRIRFKPGYGRIWRSARLEIQPLISVYAKYQYRLTTRLQTYFFSHRHTTSKKIHMVLEDSLIMATFTTDRWVTREFLNSNLVFLNGISCVNPRTVLFMGDLVQMLVNLKFYIARRWIDYWTSLRLNRIQKIFHRKNKPLGFDRTIYKVRELPEWFYTVRFTYSEVPKIFELDFFTLSFFVVHDRLSNETAFQKRLLRFPNHIVNMYNWKYIT